MSKVLKNGKIVRIVIHCSDSPDEQDHVTLEHINRWHKKRGFDSGIADMHCGYHYVIRRDQGALIETGRPEDVLGSHVKGFNKGSIGICWVGRDKLTEAQSANLLLLCSLIMTRHNLRAQQVVGHHELIADSRVRKTCPNFKRGNLFESMDAFRTRLSQFAEEVSDGTIKPTTRGARK